LKLAGGPKLRRSVPVGTLTDRISGSGTASLIYAFSANGNVDCITCMGKRREWSIQWATSDQVGASVSKQLTRVWKGNVNFEYAKNRQISGASSLPGLIAGSGGRPESVAGSTAYFSMDIRHCPGSSAAAPPRTTATQQLFLSFNGNSRPLILR